LRACCAISGIAGLLKFRRSRSQPAVTSRKSPLAQGSGALGVTQVREIVGNSGAAFLDSLPDELQNFTVFAAGIPVGAKQSEATAALVKFLKSSTAIMAKGAQVD
jgi:ABC-type molybdate transport system substrate-binding protein